MLGLHYCSEGTVWALDDRGMLSPVSAGAFRSDVASRNPLHPLHPVEIERDVSASVPMLLARRALFAAATAALAPSLILRPAIAAPGTLVARGAVALQSGTAAVGSDVPGAALYVTVKPIDTSTGIYATAGKVPPLAAARFPAPIEWPYSFELTTSDLTPEFAGVEASTWRGVDLTVTARYDGDGVAATRGPDDLVGRTILSKRGAADDPEKWSSAVVELQGRGLAGRLLTGGK